MPLNFLLIFVLLLFPFGVNARKNEHLQIDGSSTVYPLAESLSEDFQIQEKYQLHIDLGVSGSGGGFRKFCDREVDIVTASRSIEQGERLRCKEKMVRYLELPIAYDNILILTSSQNSFLRCLSLEQLEALWKPNSKISYWSDLQPSWPHRNIHLYGASPSSGTFEYFSHFITGVARRLRHDFSSSEDVNNVVRGISGDVDSLGYVSEVYYKKHKSYLNQVTIMNSSCTPANKEEGDAASMRRSIFFYIAEHSLQKPVVQKFLRFLSTNLITHIQEAGFMLFDASLYTYILHLLEEPRFGTREHCFSNGLLTLELFDNCQPLD